jgi:hypothetical protein
MGRTNIVDSASIKLEPEKWMKQVHGKLKQMDDWSMEN